MPNFYFIFVFGPCLPTAQIITITITIAIVKVSASAHNIDKENLGNPWDVSIKVIIGRCSRVVVTSRRKSKCREERKCCCKVAAF